jgi:hypothetical protein
MPDENVDDGPYHSDDEVSGVQLRHKNQGDSRKKSLLSEFASFRKLSKRAMLQAAELSQRIRQCQNLQR